MYVEEELLGTGGYGSVHAGHRKVDNLPVAIKHIPIRHVELVPTVLNGLRCSVPLEVMLLSMAAEGSTAGSCAAVALIDNFQFDNEVIIVMERPEPCQDLIDYITSNGMSLQEDEAKFLMKQLVAAFLDLHSKGVLHRDIKADNILVQTGPDGPRIRVIDFGCGTILIPGPYTETLCTPAYTPPEYFLDHSYEADPLTVWQLGVVLFTMLHGRFPFRNDGDTVFRTPYIHTELSADCRSFLQCCLAKNASCRHSLQDLQALQWLQ
ncbi:serine/threonine-protein kinase pim-2-like [Genypterus blacodes]|uniref:serine/threonine-protein kinase pim-2-like n=1 Tax=Genypterus blacodes TaxID=154954 RepID=UPI003F75941C